MARTKRKVEEKETTSAKKQTNVENRKEIASAILTYQQNPEINADLSNDTLTEEEKICVEMLDEAMVTLPDMELNRITIPAVLDKFLKQAEVDSVVALVGKVIENVPYMSTTKNSLHSIVKRRYDVGLSKPVCFVIHTEGKARGIDVVAAMKEEGFGGGRMEKQQEVIIARGTKFRVGKYLIGDEFGEVYPIIHLYAE